MRRGRASKKPNFPHDDELVTWTVRGFIAVLVALQLLGVVAEFLPEPEPEVQRSTFTLPAPGECPIGHPDLDPDESGCQETIDDLGEFDETPDPYADPFADRTRFGDAR